MGKGEQMTNAELTALCHAEEIGVSEYKVNGDWMEYWSLFPGEGFYFIRWNTEDGEEIRRLAIPAEDQDRYGGMPIPAFLIGEHGGTLYNYGIG